MADLIFGWKPNGRGGECVEIRVDGILGEGFVNSEINGSWSWGAQFDPVGDFDSNAGGVVYSGLISAERAEDLKRNSAKKYVEAFLRTAVENREKEMDETTQRVQCGIVSCMDYATPGQVCGAKHMAYPCGCEACRPMSISSPPLSLRLDDYESDISATITAAEARGRSSRDEEVAQLLADVVRLRARTHEMQAVDSKRHAAVDTDLARLQKDRAEAREILRNPSGRIMQSALTIDSVAALMAQTNQMQPVIDAALALRNSGYDGPFVGDVCKPLFKALREFEETEKK